MQPRSLSPQGYRAIPLKTTGRDTSGLLHLHARNPHRCPDRSFLAALPWRRALPASELHPRAGCAVRNGHLFSGRISNVAFIKREKLQMMQVEAEETLEILCEKPGSGSLA